MAKTATNARDLSRAADILEDVAGELHASHTVNGEWPSDLMDIGTAKAKADWTEYRALAARLRRRAQS